MNVELLALLDAMRQGRARRVGGRSWVIDGEPTPQQRAEIETFEANHPDAFVVLMVLVDPKGESCPSLT